MTAMTDESASRVRRVLIHLACAVAAGGCGAGIEPSADPGPGVHAEMVSNDVFLGNCLTGLAGCSGEIAQGPQVFGGFQYSVPVGSLVTVRACIGHPGVANRDLYIDIRPGSGVDRTATQPFYREEATPSPVCVGIVFRTSAGTSCVGNGGFSVREYRRNRVEDPLFICGATTGSGYISCGSTEKSICLVGVQ